MRDLDCVGYGFGLELGVKDLELGVNVLELRVYGLLFRI